MSTAEKEAAKVAKQAEKEAAKVVDDSVVAETPDKPLEKADKARVDKTQVQVLNANGVLTRTYTEALHGEKMDENAKEFAKKIGGSVHYVILTD